MDEITVTVLDDNPIYVTDVDQGRIDISFDQSIPKVNQPIEVFAKNNYSTTPPATPVGPSNEFLFIFAGESNAGGTALNSKALAAEIATTSSIKIFNNTTLASFDNLEIGVNNLIGHSGFGNPLLYHCWELQMIQRILGGTFNANPTYLVKTGNGGTKIADWGVGVTTPYGTDNWQVNMINRIDAAIALRLAAGKISIPIIFYQQGINDSLAGTNITTWTNATIAHFAKIRVKWPTSIIIFLKIPAAFAGYSAAVDNVIAGSTGATTFSVSSDGASVGEVDANHYTYAGQKQNANTLIDKAITSALVTGTVMPTPSRLIWGQLSSGVTDNGDGTLNLGSVANRGGTATKKLTNVPSYVQMTRPSSGSSAVILALSSVDDAGYVNGSLAGTVAAVFEFSGQYFYNNNNTSTGSGRTPVTGDIIRLERVNARDVVLKISSNGGAQFTDITTFTGDFSSFASLTVKGINAGGALSTLNLGFGFNQT